MAELVAGAHPELGSIVAIDRDPAHHQQQDRRLPDLGCTHRPGAQAHRARAAT